MFSHLLTDVIYFSFLQAYITLKVPVEWLTTSLDGTRHERQRHLQETFHSELSVLLSASYIKKKNSTPRIPQLYFIVLRTNAI